MVRIVPLIVLLLLLVTACGRAESTDAVIEEGTSEKAVSPNTAEIQQEVTSEQEAITEALETDSVAQGAKVVKVYKSPT